ncbi:MAG: glycosyltransferase [Deltaproteobacteria bacterium]|nr:glycosyltransferase [Deltaproteobacteria bacterium]
MKKKKRNKSTVSAVKPSEKPLISVCMIAKNEEKYIDQCLSSVKPIADEIIFVDTGSTDRTVEIARKYTDKIYLHPWNNSFSEARNYYLKYAKGDWIFQIDADEELVKEDIPKVRKAVQDKDIDAIVIRIVSTARKGRSKSVHNVERIFRNNGVIQYEGRVHNRLVGITSPKIYPIRILHYGYDILESDAGKKFERNVSLLRKDLEDNPDNPATHHYLSCSYLSRKMDNETIEHGLKAINLADLRNNQDMMFLWTHYNLSLAYYRSGNLKMASEVAMNALKKYPDHIDSHFMMIMICFDQKRWKDLIYHADRYLRLMDVLHADPSHFGTLVTCSLNEEWNIHVLMGIACIELGQEVNSQKSFEKAIQSALEPFIALRAIGIYFYNKNFMAKSLLYLEKARRLNANDETVNDLLAKISHKTEEYQKEPTISCCMIVRDEEEFLEECLKSIKNHVDELIIVDTGSTDNTVDIARKFTDRIYFHPWEGSFSKARNQALQYATGDWIFQIDGDEELVEGSGERLRQAVRETGEADAIFVNIISIYSGGRKTARHNFERLFRNNGVIHYESIVHNRVVGQTCTKPSKIELMHYGYNVEEKKANAKFIRTADLLKEQIAKNPDDPMPHQYLGTSYLARGMFRESIEESTLAIHLADAQGNEHGIYLSTHHNAAIAFFHLEDLNHARDYSLRALKKFPNHLDSMYMMTILSAEDKQWENVLNYGLRFLELRDDFDNNPDKMGEILNATIREGGSVNLLIGHAYHALKDSARMDKHYKVAEQMSDDKWQTWWNIGTFHMDRSGDLGLSHRYLDLALVEAPKEPSVWYMLAKWNGKAANDKDEKRCLSRVFELGCQDVIVLNRLAVLSLASDDLTTATQALDTLLNIDHQNYAALCNFGLLHRRQNSLDRAMEAFSKAIEINPQEPVPWFNLGEIAMELGQFDNARMFFERVYNLEKGMLKALLYLCEIELRQNRIVEFIHWCDLLLKELQLNRNRTIHTIEDLSGILQEINMALIHDSVLSAQVEKILSLLPDSRH